VKNIRIHASDPGAAPLVGTSRWARDVRAAVARLGASEVGVLLHGPAGTGKEHIAQAIHARSRRAERPLAVVDCDAVSGRSLRSCLFGYAATERNETLYPPTGRLQEADGGTVFLKAVDRLDLAAQAGLLRLVEHGTITPLGSRESVAIDVRFLAASGVDLWAEVAAGRFLPELHERLATEVVETVSLQDRAEDVAALAEYFLATFATDGGLPAKRLAPEAIRALRGYWWPGNADELETVLERAVLAANGDIIGPQAIAPLGQAAEQPRLLSFRAAETAMQVDEVERVDEPPSWATLREVECEHIRKTLAHTCGDEEAAARLLDMDWQQFQHRLQQVDLETGRLPMRRRPQFGRATGKKAA